MRILLYASRFSPSVGGVETTARCLAENLVRLGEQVTLITETECDGKDDWPFAVLRRPSKCARLYAAREADIVHAIGASLALYPYACVTRTPFLWTHTGYQASCVDGLGWAHGEPAPIEPWPSLKLVLDQHGIARFLREGVKLLLRRAVARWGVQRNVYQSRWVMERVPLPRPHLACTPYPIRPNTAGTVAKDIDLLFVGRFVEEKGVSDLLRAFAELRRERRFESATLALAGDGPLRGQLETLVKELRLDRHVCFLGRLVGTDLTAVMSRARIGVVPSIWEEPLGGVSIELLAAGVQVIVSERGGMREVIGDAGFSFPNGDWRTLAERMATLLSAPEPGAEQARRAAIQLDKYSEENLTRRHLSLYREVR